MTNPYGPNDAHDTVVLTQVHCHTDESDGERTPAQIVAGYVAAGYGALAITDHDKVTSQPAGIDVSIDGNELSPGGQHIISLDSSYTRGSTSAAQDILDGIALAGGKAELAHPNFTVGITVAEMGALTDYMGIEVFNAMVSMGSSGNPSASFDGYAIADWDELLTDYRRDVWGFAVDDLHFEFDGEYWDIGRLHVWVASNTVSNIMSALDAGRFVADVSNYGVAPGYPEVTTFAMRLTCSGATAIEAYGTGGSLLASSAGETMLYRPDGTEHYVRFVAIGDLTEPFASLSDDWYEVEGTWTADDTLSLADTASASRLLLRRFRAGDFTAQVDFRLEDTDDFAGLLFNVRDKANSWYVAQAGAGEGLTLKETTSNNPSTNASTAFTPVVDTWYRLKVAYTAATGTAQAKVWAVGDSEPDWMLTDADTSWTNGAFGLRGRGTPEFDDLYIDGFCTYYQPVPVDELPTISLAGATSAWPSLKP